MLSFNLRKKLILTLALNIGTSYVCAKPISNINLSESSPATISFADGTSAQIYKKEAPAIFTVPMTVQENSCQQNLVLAKCSLKIPYIKQSYAAVWTKHPTRQGQPLEYTVNPNVTFGTQNYVTKNQTDYYNKLISQSHIKNNNLTPLHQNRFFAELECDQSVNSIFPQVGKVLFIDETYEGGNPELTLNTGPGARVNLNWRRYQDMPYKTIDDHKMGLELYRKSYGLYVHQSPFALAYTIQMLFQSTNYDDARDELCKIKWNVDFSHYFTQISALALGENTKFNIQGYSPAQYTSENNNPYAIRIFQKPTWEVEGVQ